MTEFRAFADILAEELKDPEFRAAWEAGQAAHEMSNRLILWRTEHGLTQKKAAEYLQVAPNTIARWERGEFRMAHPHLVRLAIQHYRCLDAPRLTV